ncbi:type 4 (IV) prepilin-like protein leader peptide processing enzyme PilD [Legionella moravica]|uniref:Prepilin leader peptidase/N-methyltransferase n=1 Tax=Legionella moravica TaxID=39962 RepID=A0A378JVN5_9GAMM|nr:A24 family peptidase [Legionella moravica]KTD35635.1 type 4 (IV) prepilin-like protein leader peptide processing enzyme PilD [Legionella moravica]STX62765.1 type 4 (IV) prepilin-like protein leader peptide processing enzyme PilD [Legionella moravica]
MINELLNYHPALMYVIIMMISLAVGSLLNVIIYRLPIMLQSEWREQCCELLAIPDKKEHKTLNLFLPRSFCPECKTQVKAWQNIPILSYLLLKGRCSACNHRISLRYPFIELLTMLLSLYAAWHFGFTAQLIFALLGIWALISLMFIDLDHQLLPDSLTLGFLWIGLIANTQNLFASLPVAVLSCAGAYIGLWLFIQLFYLVTGKIGMGHGDFKLFAAFGAWFGWVYLPLILLLSSISGAIIGIIYLRASKQSRDTTIPFGPFLCIAGLISMFWGQSIVAWYLHFWL